MLYGSPSRHTPLRRGTQGKKASAAFAVPTSPVHAAITATAGEEGARVVTVGDDGVVYAFETPLDGGKLDRPVEATCTVRMATGAVRRRRLHCRPCMSGTVVAPPHLWLTTPASFLAAPGDVPSAPVAILHVDFVPGTHGAKIIVARGAAAAPVFETLVCCAPVVLGLPLVAPRLLSCCISQRPLCTDH